MMTSDMDQNDNPIITKNDLTLKKIEANFTRSTEKDALLESLKPLRKTHGWNLKVENLASKKLNDEVRLGNDSEFENYVENLTDFGLKTLPKTISSKIQQDVSKYVEDITRPFIEIYKEAMFKAAEKGVDSFLEMKQNQINEASISSNVVYIQKPKPNNHKSVQIKHSAKEIAIQTFPGLGNYNDDDFNAIVNNDNIELFYADEEQCNSDEECGKMPERDDKILMEKLKQLEERQKRMEKDYQKAADPTSHLELNDRNSDHRQLIEKIKRLTEFGVKIYDNSVLKARDGSRQSPEILTYKWNGKFYKHVTFHNTEDIYLYLPPPQLPSTTHRKYNGEQSEEDNIPSKIAKMDFSTKRNI